MQSKSLGHIENRGGSGTGMTSDTVLARVYDVILDENHPDYKLLGRSQAIGAIRYNIVGSDSFSEIPQNLFVAYPLNISSRTYPLKNEIVLIVKGPADNITRSDSENKNYYTFIYSTWNSAHHNATPYAEGPTNYNVDLGYKFEESNNVNSLYPNHGDHIIQGRYGNSIRFGGYKGTFNTLTDKENSNKPFTLISNGRSPVEDDSLHTYENIDKDSSSIYLTSDHKVGLKQATEKNESAKVKNSIASEYKGAQIILNSNRLIFNSKKDDIVLTSKDSVSASGLNINLDGEDYIGLDAKKIYLGKAPKNKDMTEGLPQPVILGDQLERLLGDLFDELSSIGSQLMKASSVSGGPVPQAMAAGVALQRLGVRLRTRINPLGSQSSLKSKKVFVE